MTYIYRDTPVRLLGYADEFGEAFRPSIHISWVRLIYGIASACVLFDTLDKTLKTSKRPFVNDSKKYREVFIAGIETLIGQSFAPVIVPCVTMKRMCVMSVYVLKYTTKLPAKAQNLTTCIGLPCIPFIVKPIDLLIL
jgi:fission process protein 1